MIIKLRRSTPMEIIQINPHSLPDKILRIAGNYQDSLAESKKPIVTIPYMSKVIKYICGRTQHLLIDLPDNCVGIFDSQTLALKDSKNYQTQGRLSGAVQIEGGISND